MLRHEMTEIDVKQLFEEQEFECVCSCKFISTELSIKIKICDYMSKYMSEWRCGKCGKIHNFEEFLMLKKIKAVESDIDPAREHGFVGVCDCGYRFHLDRWRLQDEVEIKTDKGYVNIIISTIDLELNHGYEKGENIWYETMIFPGGLEDELKWIKCNYTNRYETQEEAIKDHNRVVNLLKEGKYKIECLKELIILGNGPGGLA